MKLNKTNTALLALAAVLLIPVGCKKGFLDQTDSQHPTSQVLFNKPADGVALVNAIYDTYQNSDLLFKSIWYYANYQTHDFLNWGNDRAYNIYAIPANFNAIEVFWSHAYIGIARANSAIPIIADMKTKGVLDAATADRLTGEIYFMRGMTYYYLGASFGGVPLELKTGANLGLTPKSTQDQVFAQVVADLKLAVSLLPLRKDQLPEQIGRANKGAALGYLGAAQMWLKDYAGALVSFNQIEGQYSLLPNFVDIHEYTNQNNAESLFEVQFDVAGTQSWGAGNEVAWIGSFGYPEEVDNFGYDFASAGLYTSYQPGDTRKLATVIGPGDINISPGIIAAGGIAMYPLVKAGFANHDPRYIGDDGKIINTCGTVTHPWVGSDNSQLRSGYYSEKMWRDPSLTGNSGGSIIFGAQNQILLRFGEILLDKAECQIRTGDVAGGLATIKRVRDRAFGGSAPAVVQDGDKTTLIQDPLQIVYSEYRHELSSEYSTFYDLRRAGVATAFVQSTYGMTIPAGREIYPIPQYEIGLNPNLTQNPGY